MPNGYGIPYRFNRRRMLDFFLGGGILAFLGTILFPIFRFFFPAKFTHPRGGNVRAARKGELKPNSAKLFRIDNNVGLLIRTPAGEYRAFSAQCTHLSCTVQYRPDLEHIWCACHNGHYDLFGKNIKGPPPRPLTSYQVKIRGENVYVLLEGPEHHG